MRLWPRKTADDLRLDKYRVLPQSVKYEVRQAILKKIHARRGCQKQAQNGTANPLPSTSKPAVGK